MILALVYFGPFIAAFPLGYAVYQSICEGDGCPVFQLTAGEVEALEDFGISLELYAGYWKEFDSTELRVFVVQIQCRSA